MGSYISRESSSTPSPSVQIIEEWRCQHYYSPLSPTKSRPRPPSGAKLTPEEERAIGASWTGLLMDGGELSLDMKRRFFFETSVGRWKSEAAFQKWLKRGQI
jgi:hypothetical protein